jgi:hypothetical protein
MSIEQYRLDEARDQGFPWKKWGPYLSERQWGTVREDYSDDGNAWDYFSHDQARSPGISLGRGWTGGDLRRPAAALLCARALEWPRPRSSKRLFGLANREGNHGEDVKEYYFYLDTTPTHSYLKYLYKYPQVSYPYDDLVATNRRRGRNQFEYELLDTGVFDQDRYSTWS